MPEIRLKGTRVPALVSKLVAAAVPQHVRMNAKGMPARWPSLAIILRNHEGVTGPPRSDTNTCGPSRAG